jgi:hypothetical protein
VTTTLNVALERTATTAGRMPLVPHDRFAEVWNASPTRAAAAHALGLKVGTAASQAKRLRSAGVALKAMPGGVRPIGRRLRRTAAGKIPREWFIRTWNASATVKEAAGVLGMTVSGVRNRASRLRLAGHAVKRMPLGPPAKPQPANVALWNAAATASEAAEAMGRTLQAARAWAARARRAGVPVKVMGRGNLTI